MRNLLPASLLILLLLFCSGIGCAQQTTTTPAAPASDKDLATIHIYRYDYDSVVFWFLTKTLPVYFAKGSYPRMKLYKIAGLRKKRYFVMRLPDGTYSFDTSAMSGKFKLEVAAGGEYYLRFDQGQDCPDDSEFPDGCDSRNPEVYLMPPGDARKELLKVKPIKPNNVQDRNLVIIP